MDGFSEVSAIALSKGKDWISKVGLRKSELKARSEFGQLVPQSDGNEEVADEIGPDSFGPMVVRPSS
jgi:hypothetical protein